MKNPLSYLKIPKEEVKEKTEILVPEDLNQNPDSIWKKLLYNFLFLTGLTINVVLMFWIAKARTPENKIIVLYFLISLGVNIIIIFLFFWRGMGMEILRRLKNKKLYATGLYVNTLHFLKTGVIRERFCKIDALTKSFKMADQTYVTNAKMLLNFKGISTYVHRQDNPDPMNVWEDKYGVDYSCAELDNVMYSASNFDLKAWIEKNKLLAIIIFGIIIIGILFIAVKTQNLNTMMQKGTYNKDAFINAIRVLCSNQTATQVIQSIPIG